MELLKFFKLLCPKLYFPLFSIKGLVGLHRTVQLQLLQCYCLGIDLDYCDIEWFALETNRDHSVIFETASSTAFWTLLLTMMAAPFLLRDSSHSSRYNGHLS